MAYAAVPIARQPAAAWARAFVTWLNRPGAAAVLLFILLYKLGDVSMGPMVKPFWLDSGLTVDDVALVSTTAGVGLTVAGALVGGSFTTRFGIFRGLWLLDPASVLNLICRRRPPGRAARDLRRVDARSFTGTRNGGVPRVPDAVAIASKPPARALLSGVVRADAFREAPHRARRELTRLRRLLPQ